MAQTERAIRERRRSARARRPWPVEIKNGSGRQWRGTSVDVSTLGMRVQIDKPLEVRGFMFVAFDPGDLTGPVWARFSVAWQGPAANEYGIRFLDLPPQNSDRLRRLIES